MQATSSENFNWNEEDSFSTQYLVGPLRKILQDLGPKRVLDLGCGNGSLTKRISDLGFELLGCDPDENGLEIARGKAPNVSFVQCGVYDSPELLEAEKFDVVLSAEVVEHLFYPRRLVEFTKEVLVPGGHLIITTPYHGYLKNLALSAFDKWDFHHAPLHDGGHIKFWSLRTIKQLVEPYDFEVTQFRGAGRCIWFWKSMIVVCQLR